MSRDVALRLRDLVEAMRLAVEFAGQDLGDRYFGQPLVRSAVERQLITVGEAVKQLPAEVQARAPQVDWRGLARLRDLLTHVYFGIDDATVYEIATTELPEALAALALAGLA